MSATELTQKIQIFAVLSRLAIITLQAVFNLLIPDHNAGVFNPTLSTNETSAISDRCVELLLGGFRRWDAIYFTHISQYGYTYENCLAFFPLYPSVVHFIAKFLLFPFYSIFSTYSLTLITASFLNFVLFIKTAENIFNLGRIVLQNDSIAYKAALLFCINPASVFMTAPYSESMFLYLTTSGMLCIESNKLFKGACLFGLSCAARSNGLLSVGYLLYKFLQKIIQNINRIYNGMATNISFAFTIIWIIFIYYIVPYIFLIMLVFLPFVVYQYYCYKLFCGSDIKPEIPQHLIEYGKSEGLKILGIDQRPVWCSDLLPLAYSYIQKHYWNQGLFNYWELKQIPNFLLATPSSILTVAAAVTYFRYNRYTCLTLGLDEPGSMKKCPPPVTVYHPSGHRLLPYVLYALVLTVFGWFCIHTQVLTRMLFSSCPVLYWHAAYLVSMDTPAQKHLNKYDVFKVPTIAVETGENIRHSFSNLLTNQIHRISTESFQTKCLLWYFLGYFVIGTALFCNFLPWT